MTSVLVSATPKHAFCLLHEETALSRRTTVWCGASEMTQLWQELPFLLHIGHREQTVWGFSHSCAHMVPQRMCVLGFATVAPNSEVACIWTEVREVIALQQLRTRFTGQETSNLIQLVASSMTSSKVSMQTQSIY